MLRVQNPIEHIRQETGLEWFFAMETDRFVSGSIDEISNVNVGNLTEMRAFCREYEIKAFRASLAEEFAIRDSRDIGNELAEGRDIISKTTEQYLDIDDDRSESATPGQTRTVFATGGGAYVLPAGATKLEILNYYITDEVGFYKPFDFRVVGFKGKEEA